MERGIEEAALLGDGASAFDLVADVGTQSSGHASITVTLIP